MIFNIQDIRPLTEENLADVYDLYDSNEKFFKITFQDFRNQTLRDIAFNPELSLIYHPAGAEKPVGALIGVVKKGIIRLNLIVKVFIIDPKHRRKKIGTHLFQELVRRAKQHLKLTSFVIYGFSPPQFLQPGVDVRHTSLLFFLKSMGLKQRKPRNNLTVQIPKEFPQPKSEINGYTLQRITPEYYEPTLQFIKKEFIAPTWPRETKLTLEGDKPTTFIALDSDKNVVGFAAHKTCFTGSFGPTGVAKSIRDKGIGGELLKWCVWDIKQLGLDTCTIMYVVGNTVKYYSKVLGAYINPVHIPMSRSILHWWNLK
jgi:N-acetylglutamate synthase-like GNAT family acetyltransferase